MFSFCMYCCKERCAAITLSVFSTVFMLTAAASIYLTLRFKQESYVWDLQEDPVERNATSSSTQSLVEAA